MINPVILREYDIRGIVGKNLFNDDAVLLAKEIGTKSMKSKHKTVIVGYDGRKTSPEIRKYFIDSLLSTGVKVIDIGLVPTPMLYFAANIIDNDYAVVITASHNPPEYNGFKITKNAKSFFGQSIKELAKSAEQQNFIEGEGKLEKIDVSEEYIKRIIQNIQINPNLTIIWDPANGSACNINNKLLKHIPGNHIIINNEVDGNFPNHFPDPTVEKNLDQLKAAIKKHNADIGFSFDGDGDRIGVVDSQGRVIWGDQLLTFFAFDILKDHPNSTIIADVKASNIFVDEVKKAGGNPIIWKTGHSLIKSKMQEENALLAGEMSGHIFFKDKYYGFDDALYAALRTLDIISKQSNNKIDDFLDYLPKTFSTNELRIECEEAIKFKIINEIQTELTDKSITYNNIDGIRADNDNGWWLLRASNTSSSLVVRCESSTQEKLDLLISEVDYFLKPYNLSCIS